MSTNIARGNLLKTFAVTVTWNPAAVATITTAEQTVTVTGVKVGDIVLAYNKPSNTTGAMPVNARVSAADTIAVTFVNPTAGSVDPASEAWTFVIGRAEVPLSSLPSIFNA
jgi:hypothetical protein